MFVRGNLLRAPALAAVAEPNEPFSSSTKNDEFFATDVDLLTRQNSMALWWVAGTSHNAKVQRVGRSGAFTRDFRLAKIKNDSYATDTVPTRPRPLLSHVINSAIRRLRLHMETGAVPRVLCVVQNREQGCHDVGGRCCCGFMGAWVPFTDQQLRVLYLTHDDCIAKVVTAADTLVIAGLVLPEGATPTVPARELSLGPPVFGAVHDAGRTNAKGEKFGPHCGRCLD